MFKDIWERVASMDSWNDACTDAACHIGNRRVLERAKREWESTADSLPQLVCLLDDDGCILRINRTVEQWALGGVVDVRKRGVHELLHPGCVDPACYLGAFWPQARNSLAEGCSASCEAEDRVLKRHLQIQVRSPVLWQGGKEPKKAGFAVAIVHDITELKRTEAKLKKLNDDLELRVEARTLELVGANRRLMLEIEERRQAEEALRKSENELRLLSAQLLTAEEKERKRIASELHDGIGQSLSAVKFYVENGMRMLGNGSLVDGMCHLEGVVPKIQAAIEEVRRISMDLRPSTLDDLGVIATLAWFCREFQAVYGGIHIEKEIDLQEGDVPPPLKTVIYRIFQEAMNNIAKHGGAEFVRVSLKKADGEISLVIEDRGIGFDPAEVFLAAESPRGVGLASMRERAEFAGGTYSIRSAKGDGTIIRASWPCCDRDVSPATEVASAAQWENLFWSGRAD